MGYAGPDATSILGGAANAAEPATLLGKACILAGTIESQASQLEYALARIFGNETATGNGEGDRPNEALPSSLSRIQMASHRIAKVIEALGEVG